MAPQSYWLMKVQFDLLQLVLVLWTSMIYLSEKETLDLEQEYMLAGNDGNAYLLYQNLSTESDSNMTTITLPPRLFSHPSPLPGKKMLRKEKMETPIMKEIERIA